jgi:hypothetical protein
MRSNQDSKDNKSDHKVRRTRCFAVRYFGLIGFRIEQSGFGEVLISEGICGR